MVYSRRLAATSQLQVKLRAAPVATLGVVSAMQSGIRWAQCTTPTADALPDGVAGPHADPLRKRPVLTLLLGQLDLDLERLMRRLERAVVSSQRHTTTATTARAAALTMVVDLGCTVQQANTSVTFRHGVRESARQTTLGRRHMWRSRRWRVSGMRRCRLTLEAVPWPVVTNA